MKESILCRPTFVRQKETLQKRRYYSACELFVSKAGDPLVAIIGGINGGNDVWNPTTKTVETFFDVIPPNEQHYYPQLLAIKGGSELILYGGYTTTVGPVKDIWKYVVSDNTWTKYGFNSIFDTPVYLSKLKIS